VSYSVPNQSDETAPYSTQEEVRVAEVTRLTKEQYDAYVKALAGMGQPVLDNATTEQSTAYRLGIQFALQKLRDGWVLE
jgi:hypothetical protein